MLSLHHVRALRHFHRAVFAGARILHLSRGHSKHTFYTPSIILGMQETTVNKSRAGPSCHGAHGLVRVTNTNPWQVAAEVSAREEQHGGQRVSEASLSRWQGVHFWRVRRCEPDIRGEAGADGKERRMIAECFREPTVCVPRVFTEMVWYDSFNPVLKILFFTLFYWEETKVQELYIIPLTPLPKMMESGFEPRSYCRAYIPGHHPDPL